MMNRLNAPSSIAAPASASLSSSARPYAVLSSAAQSPTCSMDMYAPVTRSTPSAAAATVEKWTTVLSHSQARSSSPSVFATAGTTNAICANPPTQTAVPIRCSQSATRGTKGGVVIDALWLVSDVVSNKIG